MRLVPITHENAWDVLAAHFGHDASHAHVHHTAGDCSPFPWLNASYVLVCCNSVLTDLGHVALPGQHCSVLLSLN